MNSWITAIGSFTNRELAIVFWLSIGFAYILYNREIRKSFFNVVKAAFQPTLIPVWLSSIAYTAVVVLLLYKVKFWNFSLLKDTLIWIFFSMSFIIPTVQSRNQTTWINNYVKNNFSVLVIVEFISSSYTFSILTEIILVLLSIILILIIGITERNMGLGTIYSISKNILSLIGAGIIIHSIYNIIFDLSNYTTLENIQEFSLPPILTLFFIPYLFCIYIYGTYNRVFSLVAFKIKDAKLQKYTKQRAIKAFKLNTALLNRWRWLIGTKTPETKSEVDKLIGTIIEIHHIEKHPPTLRKEAGWNHTKARFFLDDFQFIVNDYTQYCEDEWGASGLIELNNEILPDIVAYYVDGNKSAATQLKLTLNVQDGNNSKNSDLLFRNICDRLLRKATSTPLSKRMEEAIFSHTYYEEKINFYRITIIFKRFPSDNGYTIKFVVNTPNSKGIFILTQDTII